MSLKDGAALRAFGQDAIIVAPRRHAANGGVAVPNV